MLVLLYLLHGAYDCSGGYGRRCECALHRNKVRTLLCCFCFAKAAGTDASSTSSWPISIPLLLLWGVSQITMAVVVSPLFRSDRNAVST